MKISALVLSFFIGVLSTNIYTFFMSQDTPAQTNCLENSTDEYQGDVAEAALAATEAVEVLPPGLQSTQECVFCNMMKIPLPKSIPAPISTSTESPKPVSAEAEVEYYATVVTNAIQE